MAESSKTGLLDLEKELNCSICTEVLYQPLTLLDCLHTFCGSCLKLWFEWQASQGANYTCPSCRAVVRGTRPDAKITTLLEMFLQVNPDKKRTEEEKQDVAAKYTPGDVVAPPQRRREEDEEDDVDRRMIEEVREMSLRDGDRSRRAYERGARHRPRSRDTRNGEGLRPGRSPGNRATTSSDSRSQARHIEHQSSLRSLISTDDVDSAEMEEEILRQILEEGLLDGIDLHSMSAMQEDELSERIADAYRRRHTLRAAAREDRSRETREARRSAGSRSASEHRQVSPRHHTSPPHTSPRQHTSPLHPSSSPSSSSAREPSSRLQVTEAQTSSESGRRRSSNERRRQTSPSYSSRHPPSGQSSPGQRSTRHREAARLVTDLSDRMITREGRQRRLSDQTRHARRELDLQTRPVNGGRAATNPAAARQSTAGPSELAGSSIPIQQSPIPSQQAPPRMQQRQPLGENSQTRVVDDQPLIPTTRQDSVPFRPSAPPPPPALSELFAEPSIACDGCGKTQIQYDLHENCAICKGGEYNLCHRCYREGKGCYKWYGFGKLAWHRFQQSRPPQTDPPHALVGRQYMRAKPESMRQNMEPTGPMLTSENPADRLLSGSFCSICSSFAGDCFWVCDWCNDGEWGYCNRCVNQGRCCTHPLLPLAHTSTAKSNSTFHLADVEASFAPLTAAKFQTFPPTNVGSPNQYRPLTFRTSCDVCRRPVAPDQSRYHCYSCAAGDYDICVPCYDGLVDSGRISRDNGHSGWRRCPRGHRMIVFYFEDSATGQHRVVLHDLVGGHFLRDDSHGAAVQEPEGRWRWLEDDGGGAPRTREVPQKRDYNKPSGPNSDAVDAPLPQQFPPDGGVGMQLVAAYAWVPAEGVTNELSFPRGAEIREAMEISGDWYLGSYAGAKGLFPSTYTKLLNVVRM